MSCCRPWTSAFRSFLFDHGVDALAGTRVADPEAALRCIGQGASFRQIRGTRRLTLRKSPGRP